jgi:methionine-rich copper-binding protein CopC
VDRAGTSWRNDRPLAVNEFNAGLTVRFSEQMAPASLTDRTFEVWLHIPEGDGPFVRPIRVPGVVTAGNDPGTPAGTPGARLATFRPRSPIDAAQVGEWTNTLKTIDSAAGVRAVVLLRGDKILNLSEARALDGTAFGRLVRDGYDLVTELTLPSGDGRPGGDFESWLFLTGSPAPVRVTRISPANNAVLPAFPASIQVIFSKEIRQNSVTSERVVVRRPLGNVQVFGPVTPFPFNPAATTWSGLTFTPGDDAASLPPGTWEITLRDLVDVDGLTLDGAGSGTPSPFVSRFTVNPPVRVPVRVARTSPADESVLNAFPSVIRIEFDKPVRVDTLTPQTVHVLQAPLADPVGFDDVEGKLIPQPPIQNGLTRAVEFRAFNPGSVVFPGLIVVDVRGDGPPAVIDEDGFPLDGGGTGSGRGSRFSFSFNVGRVDR